MSGRDQESRRSVMRHHMRGLARHLKGLFILVLGIEPEVRVTLNDVLHPPGPPHPSALCTCGLEHGATLAEHRIDCPWALVMCRTCDGTGHCPSCMGDGTDPSSGDLVDQTEA